MTGTLAVKLRRDLRAAWSRLLLMVIAIAVSLVVFGAVLAAWSTSSREASRAYLGTEPASATILLDRPVRVEQMAAIAAGARSRQGVIEATGRTQFETEVEVGGRTPAVGLQVFVAAPDDPMRMAVYDPRPGGWPPPPGGILLGTDSLSLLGAAVGDTVVIELPTGEDVSLRVVGVVYDPSLAPAPQERRGHGYVSTAALAAAAGPAVLDQLKIQVAEPGGSAPAGDREAIVAVASDVGQWLQREHGLAVREIQVPPPFEHPHQRQADALLASLLAGGAAALLLSTILVASMLNGLFTRQVPQIGIMKAIGARSVHIGALYVAMTLLVALAATSLAAVPAIVIGLAGGAEILGFLGIEAQSLAPAWWTYPAIGLAGLVLPPLMALPPLVRASRITVRAAIDHHGLGSGQPAAAGLLGWLGRRWRLDRGVLLALRNTTRRPARSLLSIGLLASAGTVFVAGLSLSAGVDAVADEVAERRSWDVDVQLAAPATAGEVTALVVGLPGVRQVEGWTTTRTGVAGPSQIPVTRTYPDQGHGGVSVTAIPPAAATFTPPEVVEGRWLEPGETGAIVLNQVARLDTVPGVRAGDVVELSLGGQPTAWRVVGFARERGGGGGAYVTAEGLTEALGRSPGVNQLRIVTDSHDEQTRRAVAGAVDDALTGAGVEVRSAASIALLAASTEAHLGPIVAVLLAIAIAMAVVGCIGLASTMSANVLDRRRELAVMHALGAGPGAVRRIVTAEAVVLALASCLVAVVPTLVLTAAIGAGLGNLFMNAPLPFRVSPLAAGTWIVIVTLGAVLATEAAANRAARLTVREALAYF